MTSDLKPKVVAIALWLSASLPSFAEPVISEFMAVNDSTLQDEDGDFSDWIEIHNPDGVAVDLGGWHLTDDSAELSKWTFPSVTIPPGGYLVVFASDKDRDAAGSELHTNFKLSGGGEFLALVMPEGDALSTSFDPYPQQVADAGYGLSFTPQTTTALAAGATVSIHVPDALSGPALADQWWLRDYVEGENGETWSAASSGVGFGDSFSGIIGASGNIGGQMLGTNPSAFARIEFDVANLDQVDAFRLRMQYDDGFVAYLNGEEIARSNAPDNVNGEAPASGLVTLYDFENDLDDDAADYTNGTGVATDDLSPTGAAAFAPGVVGQAVRITSAGLQRLRAPDSDDLDLAPSWTLEAFVRPDSGNTGEWDRFWTKWGDGGEDWHWSFRGGNNGLDLFVNGSDNIINHNSTATVPLNVWSHVALVGDQSTGTITAWLNGTQVGSTPWRAVSGSGGGMSFGNFSSPANAFQFSGLIDEAAIWSVALTPQQLASHAAAIGASPANSAEAYGLTPFTATGGGLDWQSTAASERTDAEALAFEDFDLTSRIDLLEQGSNLLAIHGLNANISADHFLILPEVTLDALSIETEDVGYLADPSPGAANPDSSTNLGPVVGAVTHAPAQPGAQEDITVTAEVGETLESIASVTLMHRVGFGSEVSVTMVDDGSGADALAGDGIFTATISAARYGPGEMVRWKVNATDNLDGTTTAPKFPDPSASPEYFGTVINDATATSALPILHWFVQSPNLAETGSGTRASVAFNGEFYDNVFVRIRGDTARSWPKKSYKFDFNDGYDFRFDPDLPRVDEINVNTVYTDKSYVRTVLAYETFRDAGSPYSISFPLRVEQNGAFYSVALFVEQPDRDYLRRNELDDEGALYKAKSNSIQGLSSFNRPADSGIQKKNRREEDFSDLQSLIDSLALNGDALGDYLFDNIDIPSVVNNMAANIVIQNIDRTVKNFYLYRDTEGSGEWMFFPWDVDLSFGPNALNTNTIVTAEDTGRNSSHPFMGTAAKPYDGLWNGLLDAMIDRPETREMVLRRVRTLGDAFLNTTYYENRIDELVADLGPDVALDRSRWGASAHFSGSTLSLLGETNRIKNEFLIGRRSHLFGTHSAETGSGTILVPEASAVTALVPTNNNLGDSWQIVGFDDSGWLNGVNAVGYERAASQRYTPLLGIDLMSPDIPAEMRIDSDGDNFNDNNSCYLRYEFNLADRGSIGFLKLRVKYDDGFVAFLNGTRIASRNTPTPLTWNAEATAPHSDNLAVEFVDIDVSAFTSQLLDGANVLAVQAMNQGSSSSDMLFSCTLLDESSSTGTGVGIPSSQPLTPPIEFGQIEFNPASGNQDEEFIQLLNPNSFPVDISGWQLTGGVDLSLKPGTVIPAGGTLFLSPDVVAFRARTTSPTGGEGHFVLGNYSGHLSNFGETLTLSDSDGLVIAETETTADPSDVQRFLVVSEVHYHPAGDPGEEFIELMNVSDSVTLNLDGVRFVSGIEFDFSGTLAPGARILVVRDQVAFESRFGAGLPIVGEFSAGTILNNDGETLKIDDATNSTVKEFTYNDKLPWPEAADGIGASLVLINPRSDPDPNIASNWRPSALPNGSPGATDSVAFSGEPNSDLNNNGIADLIDHALFNGLPPTLTPSAPNLRFEFSKSLAADDVVLKIEISTDLSDWRDGSELFEFVRSEYSGSGGQTLIYEATSADIPMGRLYLRLSAELRRSQ